MGKQQLSSPSAPHTAVPSLTNTGSCAFWPYPVVYSGYSSFSAQELFLTMLQGPCRMLGSHLGMSVQGQCPPHCLVAPAPTGTVLTHHPHKVQSYHSSTQLVLIPLSLLY